MTLKSRLAGFAIRLFTSRFHLQNQGLISFAQLSKTVQLLRKLDINIILDVGANRGTYGQHLRNAGYEQHILSFEPIVSEFHRLQRLCSNDSKWSAFNYALGSESGTKQFNITDTGGFTVLSSFLPIRHGLPTSPVPVLMQRLDDVLPSLIMRIEEPKIFLKMDTQGFDAEVIKGADRSMNLILGFQSEIAVVPLYEGMRTYTDSLEDYHNLGFQLVDLFPVTRTEEGLVREYDCLMKRSPA